MRFITGFGKRMSTRILTEKVKWLTVYEMAKYHTLILTWKIVNIGTPRYLREKIKVEDDRKISTTNPRIQNTARGFRWQSVVLWNEMEGEMRNEKSLPRFKLMVKKWLISKRPPDNAT